MHGTVYNEVIQSSFWRETCEVAGAEEGGGGGGQGGALAPPPPNMNLGGLSPPKFKL